MSGNHNQSLDRALKIVDQAAECGVDAVKIQTFTADTMTLNINNNNFKISDRESLWDGETLYDLYSKAHTPWEWHEPIINHAQKKGIICFSSPFDESAVEFLEKLNVPAYKIASFECIDIPLISKIAETGKPIIISTGMATEQEISEAVRAAKSASSKDLAILKCTSTYPALPTNTNLQTIQDMRSKFKCEVGLSDHTKGIGVSLAAISFGATIIEKHFTLDRADGGVDSEFSLEPDELKSLVIESQSAWQAIGNIHYGCTNDETNSLKFRRSIFVTEDLRAGDISTKNNIKRIRPGYGLKPKFYEEIIGKKARKNIKKGTPLDWNLILDVDKSQISK